jgi:mannose-6-phosphate isomerase-like protein (cupin superfamily)
MPTKQDARKAELVLRCEDLDAALSVFTVRLGLRLDSIFPADDPEVATLSGHGVRVRLERHVETSVPQPMAPSLVVTRRIEEDAWVRGRAGMLYRDLVPDRQAGGFIASHIRIPEAGPVPDYVHFHRVRFQMIYCRRGWVRVVYEDQGPPFVLRAGDCVLQPPQIRHRVLESSAAMEVIEIASPARHETLVEHDLKLPTATERPDRLFGGQRFVRHEAASALWRPWRVDGFEARDTGITGATGGLAEAHVLRPHGAPAATAQRHDGELLFVFVLSGAATLRCDGHGEERLGEDDCCVVPAGLEHAWTDASADLELLRVALPASR